MPGMHRANTPPPLAVMMLVLCSQIAHVHSAVRMHVRTRMHVCLRWLGSCQSQLMDWHAARLEVRAHVQRMVSIEAYSASGRHAFSRMPHGTRAAPPLLVHIDLVCS